MFYTNDTYVVANDESACSLDGWMKVLDQTCSATMNLGPYPAVMFSKDPRGSNATNCELKFRPRFSGVAALHTISD